MKNIDKKLSQLEQQQATLEAEKPTTLVIQEDGETPEQAVNRWGIDTDQYRPEILTRHEVREISLKLFGCELDI